MPKQHNNNPIGIFDSGLGGLTVVKECIRRMPHEDVIYYGDTARVPYGTKSKESIVRFSLENTAVLLKHNVKMVVVACNSSSSYALEAIRETFDVPVMGVIYPGARKAVDATKKNKVGVIATSATINSGSYEKTIHAENKAIKIINQACPLFVPLAEEGWTNKAVTEAVAKEYLLSLKKKNIDTLILGCTHYPLLKNVIKKVMGQKVTLIDSAKEVATEVKHILKETDQSSSFKRKGRYKFLISDKPQAFKKIAKKFLGQDINAVQWS